MYHEITANSSTERNGLDRGVVMKNTFILNIIKRILQPHYAADDLRCEIVTTPPAALCIGKAKPAKAVTGYLVAALEVRTLLHIVTLANFFKPAQVMAAQRTGIVNISQAVRMHQSWRI